MEQAVVDDVLTIGQLAAETQIGVSTIRFYEQKGLIDGPPRNKSGYRLYSRGAVRRLLFVKKSRELGFSLREVAQLIKFAEQQKPGCDAVKRQLQGQFEEVNEEFDRLTWRRDKLKRLLEGCENPSAGCTLYEMMLEE